MMIQTRVVEISGDFSDPVRTWQWFLESVNAVRGISVLNSIKHEFPGGGLTGVVVIAESHCAIHTWPESNYAWTMMATCGDPTALDVFAALMCERVPGMEVT